MAFNIASFLHNGLQFGGARPTQFQVDIFPPLNIGAGATPGIGVAVSKQFSFVCTAASLPEFTVQPATCAYFGAILKYSAERVFGDWSVQVLNDEDFSQRAMFERWSNAMNTLISNRLDPTYYATKYKASAVVTQYSKSGPILRQYTMWNLWPMRISDIPLSWEAATQIERFEVNFALDYFYPSAQDNSPDVFNPTLSDDQNVATAPTITTDSTIVATGN